MENNSTRSAFESNKLGSAQNWINKNSYKGGYDNKLYKHQGTIKTSNVLGDKQRVKLRDKPEKDLIANVQADRKRRYEPYKIVKPLSN